MKHKHTHKYLYVQFFFLVFHVMRRLIGTCGDKRFYTQPTMEPFRYNLYICYTSTYSLLAYPLSGSSAGGANICFVTKEKQINGSFSTFAIKWANWTFQPRFIKCKKSQLAYCKNVISFQARCRFFFRILSLVWLYFILISIYLNRTLFVWFFIEIRNFHKNKESYYLQVHFDYGD